MKTKLITTIIIGTIFLLLKRDSFAYGRSPAGTSITSPITVSYNQAADDPDWFIRGGTFLSYQVYLYDSLIDTEWDGTCHLYSEPTQTDSFTIPSPNQVTLIQTNVFENDHCYSPIDGHVFETGDPIFTVSDSGATPTPTPTPTSPSSSSTTTTIIKTIIITPTTTPKPLVDTIPPAISLNTDFSKPFTKAPKITGKASDTGDINVGVAKVEYSVDDGKNWLSVDTIDNPGAKSTGFSFTPAIFEDGNYKLKVRAKDPTGNIGVSNTYTLIIDRLPPQVGGVLFSIGPQVLTPSQNGAIFTLQGMNTKITLSAVGGPLTIDLSAGTQIYSLVKNVDNGLWSGVLSFANPGVYQLDAKAVDGADNRTERKLNTIVVLDSGKIVNGTSPVTLGSVELWYFDNQTQRFVVWDGRPYGQQNPQNITKNGQYGFFAPAGKYYMEVKSSGFKTFRTSIFTLDISTPITTALKLEKSFVLHLGPFVFTLPDFFAPEQSVVIKPPAVSAGAQLVNNIVGNEFPNVDLFIDSKKNSTISFSGKPTVFAFFSTWSPYTPKQLESINELSGNSQINVVPIVSQESASSVSIFSKRGGYSFPIYSDPDGLLVKPLNLFFFPTHVFVDRKGIIQSVKVGVLTKDELLNNMVN